MVNRNDQRVYLRILAFLQGVVAKRIGVGLRPGPFVIEF